MRKHPPWLHAVLLCLLVLIFPAAICGANTETAIARTVQDNDALFATIAQDALTANQIRVQGEISDAAIIGSTAKNTRDAAVWADLFPATMTKTDAGNIELTTTIIAEESSWIAQEAVAVMLGSEGRANATKLDATLVTVSSTIENDYGYEQMTTRTAWEGQHRSNAQIASTMANMSPTDQTSTAAINRNETAVTTAQKSDQANRVGQNVGTEELINSKSLNNYPRPEVQHNVIKSIFNGLTRA